VQTIDLVAAAASCMDHVSKLPAESAENPVLHDIVSTGPDVDSHLGSKFDQGIRPTYPRVLTAMQLLEEESDDESTFCGPPSEPEDSGLWVLRALDVWGISNGAIDAKRRVQTRTFSTTQPVLNSPGGDGESEYNLHGEFRRDSAPDNRREAWNLGEPPRDQEDQVKIGCPLHGGAQTAVDDQQEVKSQPLILPRGEIHGDAQKFICVFQVGLEDDEEFCLVKRILGKAGNNMRRIAEECNAKVRLRGIGSGFLEGSDGKEANMPLQLHVSCLHYDNYQGAVDRVTTLLTDLYKHYRRYARSKGMECPDLKIALEEVRRDDLKFDLISQKEQSRQRDRRSTRRAVAVEASEELRPEDDRKHDRDRIDSSTTGGTDGFDDGYHGHPSRDRRAPWDMAVRSRGTASSEAACGASTIDDGSSEFSYEGASYDASHARRYNNASFVLPGGMPVPTTAAGRRAAAKAGGAVAGAIASAAAREAERQEREWWQREEARERDNYEAPPPGVWTDGNAEQAGLPLRGGREATKGAKSAWSSKSRSGKHPTGKFDSAADSWVKGGGKAKGSKGGSGGGKSDVQLVSGMRTHSGALVPGPPPGAPPPSATSSELMVYAGPDSRQNEKGSKRHGRNTTGKGPSNKSTSQWLDQGGKN